MLELLKTKLPDIILLDIEMQQMGGGETFHMIKKLYPHVKIIFLSTHKEDTLIDYFYSKGANAYLTKNTDIEVVAKTIRLVYENKYQPVYSTQEYLYKNHKSIKFSKREFEIIPKIIEGKSNREIAEDLKVSHKAVEAHKSKLFKKTNTKSVVELVSYFLKKGLNNLQ